MTQTLEQMLEGFEKGLKTLNLYILGHEQNRSNISVKIGEMKKEQAGRETVIAGLKALISALPEDETIKLVTK